jgi:hypothetical protein
MRVFLFFEEEPTAASSFSQPLLVGASRAESEATNFFDVI